MNVEIVVAPNAAALAAKAARRLADLAVQAVASRRRFSVALSGGSTPAALYRLLAEEPYRQQIPWPQTHLFWSDERCVPPDDAGSNYRLADETLISRVPLPPQNVHRPRGELEPETAARAYARELRRFFGRPQPRLDLVLLGLGQDGHTASLFPASPALAETERPVVAVEAHYQTRPAHRLTLTLPAINAARRVWFLVTGSAKADIVRAALAGPPNRLPAQLIHPTAGRLTWLLDAAAAGQTGLEHTPRSA